MTIFKEFKKMSQEKEFEFVVVNIPDKLFVSNEYQKKFLEQYYDVNESFFEFRESNFKSVFESPSFSKLIGTP